MNLYKTLILYFCWSLLLVHHPFAQSNPGEVRFIATTLVNFNQTKLSWQDELIKVDSLQWKKDRALFLLDSAVALPAFKQACLNEKFTHKNGLTNEGIYEAFVSPAYQSIREHLILVIDTSYEWNVTYQQGFHPSIGYDNSVGDSTVHTVQIQLIKYLSPEDYAAHIAHEYCHMIGFSHPWLGKWKAVPYGIQHIIEGLLAHE